MGVGVGVGVDVVVMVAAFFFLENLFPICPVVAFDHGSKQPPVTGGRAVLGSFDSF